MPEPTPHPYHKKPVLVDAIQHDGSVQSALIIERWSLGQARCVLRAGASSAHLEIATLEGTMRCETGDFVIRGVQGEYYPCKDGIFHATYERAD